MPPGEGLAFILYPQNGLATLKWSMHMLPFYQCKARSKSVPNLISIGFSLIVEDFQRHSSYMYDRLPRKQA